MMDGRNCAGNRISLLNDSDVISSAPAAKISLSPLTSHQQQQQQHHHHHHHHHHHPQQQRQHHHHQQHQLHENYFQQSLRQHQNQQHSQHHHSLAQPQPQPQPHFFSHPQRLSRASSSTTVTTSNSSAPTSPRTPLLERTGSSDSQGYSNSPSPLTPPFSSFDNQQRYYLHAPSVAAAAAAAKMDASDPASQSLYPPIPENGISLAPAYQLAHMQPPMPMHSGSLVTDSSNSPVSEPSRLSNASAASSTAGKKPTPKKNQYPCPMAKQVGCTDFFTTSGHAARHAKKHTGKKDAFCPECNKAFTRKDNMEQHRRTHQNGRGASRSANSATTTTSSSSAAATAAAASNLAPVDDGKVKKTVKSSAKKGGIRAEQQQLEAAVEQQLAEDAAAIPPSTLSGPLGPQLTQAHALQQIPAVDQNILLPPSGPYFLNTLDSGPIPPLPNSMPELQLRPTLQRSNFATSLDYVPPFAPLMGGVAGVDDALHFSYPSPGLSNGLNSLALAASERRRLSEEKTHDSSSSNGSQDATPLSETPNEVTP